MREIKFDYVFKHKKDRDIQHKIFILKEIEESYKDGKNGASRFLVEDGYELIAKRQYTGIKDKNGKDIYEGDIVKEYYNSEFYGNMMTDISIVEKDTINPSMVLHRVTNYKDFEYDFVKGGMMELEIIGNIYEDSHLLSGE